MQRHRFPVGVLLVALLTVGTLGRVAAAQDAIPHLILSVLETPQDKLYGYLVFHEEAKTEYRLTILPSDAAKWRCNLTGMDRITIDEATHTYEGRDGEPCVYASFRPDVPPPPTGELPVPTDTARKRCPTCPG